MKHNYYVKNFAVILTISAITAACGNDADSTQQASAIEAETAAPAHAVPAAEADPVAAAAEKAMKDAESRLDDKSEAGETSTQKSAN